MVLEQETPEYSFQGWLGLSPDSARGNMEWGTFEPKKWEDSDVDIQVTHCGVCGSDIHTLRSGWEQTPYPCCVGHEIVGRAVRVGRDVQHIKVGDRVGVGPQALSCLEADCLDCSTGRENYCTKVNLSTYASIYPDEVGKSYGGYSDYHRAHGHFVVKIPDGLSSDFAAPMLCAGVTVYSPLRREGCGPGMAVGVVGVGGLGHFAVLFAKAFGADKVVGISRKLSKKDKVLALGADHYIATDDDLNWDVKNARTLDLIISTISDSTMPLDKYLSLLKVGGTLIQVGLPDKGALPAVNAFTLVGNNIKLGGSNIGSPTEISEMLQFATEKKITPWVQMRSLKDANQVIMELEEGRALYRFVLVNEKHTLVV